MVSTANTKPGRCLDSGPVAFIFDPLSLYFRYISYYLPLVLRLFQLVVLQEVSLHLVTYCAIPITWGVQVVRYPNFFFSGMEADRNVKVVGGDVTVL